MMAREKKGHSRPDGEKKESAMPLRGLQNLVFRREMPILQTDPDEPESSPVRSVA
jgi:hypothetical protein